METQYNLSPIPQKDLNPQDITIVSRPGMKPAPNIFLPGHSKEKFVKETPPYTLIMDNLETFLSTTVNKDRRKTSGAIVERFIKNRASTIFGNPVYFLYGTGMSIAVSVPHEEFFNSNFAIWIGGNTFSDGFFRPIRMHEVWRDLGLRKLRVEQISRLQK